MIQPEDLFDHLAQLREIAKNNSFEGSQDERDAWEGMSKQIGRALQMANSVVFTLNEKTSRCHQDGQ